MPLSYTIVKRRVRYARLEVGPKGLVAIVPQCGFFDTRAFVARHERWARRRLAEFKAAGDIALEERSESEFKSIIAKAAALYAKKLAVEPTAIKLRSMRSRWGSCGSKRSISLNSKLRYLPRPLIEHVLFHEFCHLIAMAHNKRFWALVAKEFPDYKALRRKLRQYEWLLRMC